MDRIAASEAVDPGSTPGGPTILTEKDLASSRQSQSLFCCAIYFLIEGVPALDKSASKVLRTRFYPSPNVVHTEPFCGFYLTTWTAKRTIICLLYTSDAADEA